MFADRFPPEIGKVEHALWAYEADAVTWIIRRDPDAQPSLEISGATVSIAEPCFTH